VVLFDHIRGKSAEKIAEMADMVKPYRSGRRGDTDWPRRTIYRNRFYLRFELKTKTPLPETDSGVSK